MPTPAGTDASGAIDPEAIDHWRRTVLDAWRASPQRFREDANAEEDLAHGHYRERTVIELLQNASDAAGPGGGTATVRLTTKREPRLVVANTGEPLDADGVRSLAGLRASTKTTAAGAIGTFGVGFAAVRAVSDEVEVSWHGGAVRFSHALAMREVAKLGKADPALAALLADRAERFAVLRLPYPSPDAPPPGEGFATEVRLQLTGPDAVERIAAQLAELSELTLVALPGLNRIDIDIDSETRVLSDPGQQWMLHTVSGHLPDQLAATLPVEQRRRTAWRVTWAVARAKEPNSAGPAGSVPIDAPTPTDDRSSLPARLIATFPLDATRRRIAPGPVTTLIIGHAARAYAELATSIGAGAFQGTTGDPGDERAVRGEGAGALALVPTRLPAGEIDAELHERIVEELRGAPILPGPPGARRLAPSEAFVLPAQLWRKLSDRQAAEIWRRLGELEPALTRLDPSYSAQAARLRLAAVDLADLIDRVPLTWPVASYAELYRALEPLRHSGALEELATVPVPLADGQVRRGARGLLLVPDAEAAALAAITAIGPRIVHPVLSTGPAGDLLVSLGAAACSVRELLNLPELAEAIDECDDETAVELADAVLLLVDQLARPGERFVALGRLPLRAVDGTLRPAEDLVQPGSDAEVLYRAGELLAVESAVAEQWGAAVLGAAGVRSGLSVLAHADRELADGWDEFLADEQLEADEAGEAIADLDLIAPGSWALALRLIAADPALRAAALGAGHRSHLAWWLAQRGRSFGFAAPFLVGAARAGLPGRPAILADATDDIEFLRALGGVLDPRDVSAAGWRDLWGSGAVPDATPGSRANPETAAVWWLGLAKLAREDWDTAAPSVLPAVAGNTLVWCEAAQLTVADRPQWLQRTDLGPFLPARPTLAPGIAQLVDAPLASELVAGRVQAGGVTEIAAPPGVELLLPEPLAVLECEELSVDGVPVGYWIEQSAGVLYAATLAGQAAGLADWAGRPELAPTFEVLLAGEGQPIADQAAMWVACTDS